jgi:glutamate 5-kinase
MRDFSKTKLVVVKVGTNTLSKDGGLDTVFVRNMARQIKALIDQGRKVVMITSGAIGMGAGALKLTSKPSGMKLRQACAAIGQPLLMQEYRKAFATHGIIVAQVLLTADVLNKRPTYLNLRNSIETLLELGVVPILNENDSVSTEEIGSAFGDNDRLSALVASKLDADLLILLSDIDALYDKDPREFPDAKPLSAVHEITEEIIKSAGKPGSMHASGGMKTKILAAQIASNAGCRMVLADGRVKDVIIKVLAGKPIGTIFMPKRRLSNRDRWILNSAPAGTIVIDEGAMKAVRNRKSLLPSGIVSIQGEFEAGEVVMLNSDAKAVSSFSSTELASIAGKHSTEIRTILGPKHRDVVATPDDILLLS